MIAFMSIPMKMIMLMCGGLKEVKPDSYLRHRNLTSITLASNIYQILPPAGQEIGILIIMFVVVLLSILRIIIMINKMVICSRSSSTCSTSDQDWGQATAL